MGTAIAEITQPITTPGTLTSLDMGWEPVTVVFLNGLRDKV